MSSRRTLRVAIAGTAAVAALCSLAAFSAPQVAAADKGSKGQAVTIYLTRHGETMLNTLDRVQGWSDSPLTEEGRETAEYLGEGLAEADVSFKSAYSADMVRHWETVSLALGEVAFKGNAVRDERLREIAFGRFEGAGNDEMWSAIATELGYAGVGELFMDPEFDFNAALESMVRLNEGSGLTAETPAQVADRAVDALTDIAAERARKGGGNVLVVSSGITIMAALEALGGDLSGVEEGIENGAVSELQYRNGTWTVLTVNDLSYVEAGRD